jgi:hypothetical protein
MKTAFRDFSATQLRTLLQIASKPTPRLPAKGIAADLLKRAIAETTSVEELATIKDRAKTLIAGAKTRPQRDAATLLYHAAVAAAFVRHDRTISGRPMEKQQRTYEAFAAAWADHPIGRLFHDAAGRIAGRARP